LKRRAGEKLPQDVEELRAIRKLLIASLLVAGVDAPTLAKILGYRSASSITNEFPVRKLQKIRDHAKQ
jgi:hypothetical protein